jgi:hypothetical protein
MGNIGDGGKYPNDATLTGGERVIGTDVDGSTRNYLLSNLAGYFNSGLKSIPDQGNTIYDGYIIIARAGINKDNTIVQENDILIGSGSFHNGILGIFKATTDSPTLDGELQIRANLGSL